MSFLPWQTIKAKNARKAPTGKTAGQRTSGEKSRQEAAARTAANTGESQPKADPGSTFDWRARRDNPSPAPGPSGPTVERPVIGVNGVTDYGFVNPVPGAPPITDFGSFGAPRTYRNGIHVGIDLNGPEGANILSIQAGTVIEVGQSKGAGGWKVVIDHGDGWISKYYHIRDNGFLVQKGMEVAAGQPIALIGHSGQTTVNHLHMEITKDGDPVDPEKLGIISGKSSFKGETGVPFGTEGDVSRETSIVQGVQSGAQSVAGTQGGPQKRLNPKDFQPLLRSLLEEMSLFKAGGLRSDINQLRRPLVEGQQTLIPVSEEEALR